MPPGDAGVTPGAVHEEERVGVLPDGSVVREFDRIEQPPVDRRNWLPWAIAVVLLIVLAGLAIWYFARDEKATVAPGDRSDLDDGRHAPASRTASRRRSSGA